MNSEPTAEPDNAALHNVESLTFTGLDAFTDQSAIAALHEQYPGTEFGVLVSGHSGDPDKARYPHLSVVEEWRDYANRNSIPVALHLCGRFAREMLSEDTLALCTGFNRVQVNAAKYDYAHIRRFAEQAECDAVIVQHREPFAMNMPLHHPKVQYLHDLSGGRGQAGFAEWPPPVNPEIRHGYAGGISPDNIADACVFTSRYGGFRLWLDMETGVRDTDDRMDVAKMRQVCEAVFG